MSADRCERCGKFRAAHDLARSDHGDEHVELVTECRWCMAPADRIAYEMEVKA